MWPAMWYNNILKKCRRPPSQPWLIRLTVTKENDNMLKFNLTLPSASASDVISRLLSVKIGNNDPVTLTLAANDVIITNDLFVGNDNDGVDVSLADVDDAGNRSVSRDQSFVLTDTIAPPQPGEIGLTITDEV
jgi:hypothetical protein